MNDYDVDPDEFARFVRDAELMRAAALRELLVSVWATIARFGTSIRDRARPVLRRRKMHFALAARRR